MEKFYFCAEWISVRKVELFLFRGKMLDSVSCVYYNSNITYVIVLPRYHDKARRGDDVNQLK